MDRRFAMVLIGRLLSVALLLLLAFAGCAQPATTPDTLNPSFTLSPRGDVVMDTDDRLTSYVNPFVGTAPGGTNFGFGGDSGDTFPGAAYPLGMVQWSPDTPSNLPGGYYYPDTTIKGFSLTHFSGRGCRVYQDVPFMPYVGPVTASPETNGALYASPFSHNNESAQPGYYSVRLDKPGVTVELSVTPRTGIGQFVFPASTQSMLLINVGGSINGTTNAGVTITPASNQLTGFATSKIGCGSNSYTLYFAAQFDRPFKSFGTWEGAQVRPGASSGAGGQSGAFVGFDTTIKKVVHVQVGISFVSIANAQANLAAENAHFNFTGVRMSADTAWNTRLSEILVQGGTMEEKSIFYTALYHTFIHPNIFSDVNGQYLGFDGKVHTVARGHAQYENVAGWDQYRSLIRLRALLDPAEAGDIAQSLVNDAQQGDGHLPRWEQANADSHGMNGDDGALMIAEAYAFGARDFDTTAALSAMVNGQPKIREGLDDYKKLGYVASATASNSAAITQEYTNADFAISLFARSLGNTSVAATFRSQAANWQHLFNPATGYIQPRNSDGSWANNFQPTSQNGFQEGDSAQYSWLEPFDLGTLFQKMGGNAAVVRRLDTFFTQLNAGPNSPYAFMGNEPCLEVPWEYDFAGAPSHTQATVRRIQTELFSSSPSGLPGNDDGGALSSWYVFSAIGLYPEITGASGFVIGSPLFTVVTLRLPGGHTLHINAPGADDMRPFVQNMHINGKPSTSLWLPLSTLRNGATLDFSLSGSPTPWATAPNDAPPAL